MDDDRHGRKDLVELAQQRKAFDVEMEFYKKDPNKAPMTLRCKIAENEESTPSSSGSLPTKTRKAPRAPTMPDVELAQLRKLWDAQRMPVSGATPASDAAAPAATR